MADNFERVKEYVLDLGFSIDEEIPEEEIVIINDEDRGIHRLVIDCEEDLVVLEQLILKFEGDVQAAVYRRL
ncbi:uncharacterized protein METZ01_LOCUS515672, partial [marine metagenome]